MLLDAAALVHSNLNLKAAREVANATIMSIDNNAPIARLQADGCNPTTEEEEDVSNNEINRDSSHQQLSKRSMEELIKLVKSEKFEPDQVSNEEIIELMLSRKVSAHRLESILGKSNANRCVEIRRQYYKRELELLEKLDQQQQNHRQHAKSQSDELRVIDIQPPASSTTTRADILLKPQNKEFDFAPVVGACCENVIGYVRLPVGLVGPLLLDNERISVPLATTEGCLVASTSRGLSALAKCGGVVSRVRKNGMTRAPIVRFVDPDLKDALRNVDRAIEWLDDDTNKEKLKIAFRSNSRYTKLIDYSVHPLGREIHIRFEAQTGDAMGMNMCSKGAEAALREMQRNFPTMDILTISGNMCTDKKPSAINWICGRGKSVECSATLTAEVIEKTLKVSIDSLYETWSKKVMIGSALAGSIGGFNCHAANIVAAIFIATGQDAAQVVSSSNCILELEKTPMGALEVHCSMPSIECGTVGGGTVLADQSDYLALMGIKGSTQGKPSDPVDGDSNACKLARIICSTVMAAELSLMASLTEGTLVKSHMTHNRSAQPCNVV